MTDYVPVGFSHLLGFAGVGAIVRADRYLYSLVDTSKWRHHQWIPYVERVRSSLGLDNEIELHQPPRGWLDRDKRIQGDRLPGIRFPSWMKCRRCSLLHWQPWTLNHDQKIGPLCSGRAGSATNRNCGGVLEQHPWVMIDTEGRMGDVPWDYLVHRGRSCTDLSQPHVILRDNLTEWVESRDEEGPGQNRRWTLSCTNCGVPSYSLDPQEGKKLKIFKHQPWRGDAGRSTELDAPASGPEVAVVDVADPRLYAACIRSALVIPPESRIRRGSVVDKIYCDRTRINKLHDANCMGESRLRKALNNMADELGCSWSEIQDAWNEIQNGYPLYGKTFTSGQLMRDEFDALTATITDVDDSEDLVTSDRSRQWHGASIVRSDRGLALVNRLIEVKRLREVRVFEGFKRNNGTTVVKPDIDGRLKWLPAIDLFGEGILLTLDESAINSWEGQKKLRMRVLTLNKRFAQSGSVDAKMVAPPGGQVSARFLLLHTLAHLLIRQFEVSCGYPAASLKERIYCDSGMAGILIYVTVPDIDGSLGGLSELADPVRFAPVLSAAMARIEWCSLDPVCSEHTGQGPNLLNLAACHGCALIPEPSCILGNQLLDRVVVKGDGNGIRGIFDFVDQSNLEGHKA